MIDPDVVTLLSTKSPHNNTLALIIGSCALIGPEFWLLSLAARLIISPKCMEDIAMWLEKKFLSTLAQLKLSSVLLSLFKEI